MIFGVSFNFGTVTAYSDFSTKKQRYVFFDTFYPIFSGKKRFTNGWVYP